MREYAAGDDLRRIVWRASARTGKLMVREAEQGITDHITIIIDTDRGSHSRDGEGLSESFETGVRAAASLGVRHLREGYEVKIETNAGPLTRSLRGAVAAGLLDAMARVDDSRAAEPRAHAPGDATKRDAHNILITPKLGQAEAAQLKLLLNKGVSVLVVALLWDDEHADTLVSPPPWVARSSPCTPGRTSPPPSIKTSARGTHLDVDHPRPRSPRRRGGGHRTAGRRRRRRRGAIDRAATAPEPASRSRPTTTSASHSRRVPRDRHRCDGRRCVQRRLRSHLRRSRRRARHRPGPVVKRISAGAHLRRHARRAVRHRAAHRRPERPGDVTQPCAAWRRTPPNSATSCARPSRSTRVAGDHRLAHGRRRLRRRVGRPWWSNDRPSPCSSRCRSPPSPASAFPKSAQIGQRPRRPRLVRPRPRRALDGTGRRFGGRAAAARLRDPARPARRSAAGHRHHRAVRAGAGRHPVPRPAHRPHAGATEAEDGATLGGEDRRAVRSRVGRSPARGASAPRRLRRQRLAAASVRREPPRERAPLERHRGRRTSRRACGPASPSPAWAAPSCPPSRTRSASWPKARPSPTTRATATSACRRARCRRA